MAGNASRVQPNAKPPPGPIGNTTGMIVPNTASNPKANTAPPIKPTEKEKGWWERWGSSAVHVGLDVVGLIPGVGEIADGANALIYLAEGDKVNAALSAAAMVPGAGMAATGAKYAKKAAGVAAEATAKLSKEAAEKLAKEAAEKAAKEKAEKEAAEAAAKKKGGKDKGKAKPKCGGRATYGKQAGDFAGNAMERDHIPSFGAMKKAFEKWAKDNDVDLDEPGKDLRKKLFGDIGDGKRGGEGGKLGRHAQTVGVPNDVHQAGDTHGAKNTPKLQKDDAGNLQGAAELDGKTHKKNIDNDKHKDCKDELIKSVDEIAKITNEQYGKFFEKLYKDTVSGKNTVNPWKGIL